MISMKKLIQKLLLLLYPWSYSSDGSIRTHKQTGKKQYADYEEDWLGSPQVHSWHDHKPSNQPDS